MRSPEDREGVHPPPASPRGVLVGAGPPAQVDGLVGDREPLGQVVDRQACGVPGLEPEERRLGVIALGRQHEGLRRSERVGGRDQLGAHPGRPHGVALPAGRGPRRRARGRGPRHRPGRSSGSPWRRPREPRRHRYDGPRPPPARTPRGRPPQPRGGRGRAPARGGRPRWTRTHCRCRRCVFPPMRRTLPRS